MNNNSKQTIISDERSKCLQGEEDNNIEIINAINPDSTARSLEKTINPVKQYFTGIAGNNDVNSVIEKLILDNTICSIYVLIQIICNKSVAENLGWQFPLISDIPLLKKYCTKKNNLFSMVYPILSNALKNNVIQMRGISKIGIESLTLEEFSSAVSRRRHRKKHKSTTKNDIVNPPKIYKKQGKIYEEYEYGLSDW